MLCSIFLTRGLLGPCQLFFFIFLKTKNLCRSWGGGEVKNYPFLRIIRYMMYLLKAFEGFCLDLIMSLSPLTGYHRLTSAVCIRTYEIMKISMKCKLWVNFIVKYPNNDDANRIFQKKLKNCFTVSTVSWSWILKQKMQFFQLKLFFFNIIFASSLWGYFIINWPRGLDLMDSFLISHTLVCMVISNSFCNLTLHHAL